MSMVDPRARNALLGGTAQDRAAGVAVGVGKTHVVGNTRSTDFPKVTPIINGIVGA